MTWTTPVLCGAVAVGTTNDHSWSDISNLTSADSLATVDWSEAEQNDLSDEIKLTQWDVTIAGGGAVVTRMKVTFDAYDSSAIIQAQMSLWGEGITINTQVKSLSNTFTTYTVDSTIATWGISAAEIDNLISNSSSYGLIFRAEKTGVQLSNGTTSIQNIALSFEYTPSSGGGGGVLLAK